MTVADRARPADIPAGRFAERLQRAAQAAASAGTQALLLGAGSDLRYLSGYVAMALERLTVLVVRPDRAPLLIVPRLELGSAEQGLRTAIEIRTWDETDDPYAMALDGLDAGPIAVSDGMSAIHLLQVQAARPSGAPIMLASTVLRRQRMIKDADEVALLRTAAHAADRVIARITMGRLVGRTEADVAGEVRTLLVEEGHDEATFAIVASGPNAASPHHDASDRIIAPGEPIVLDIGGTIHGYGSDITRTVWVTGGDATKGPDATFRGLFDVLHHAQAAATAAVRPGVTCSAIDAAARTPIDRAGYGEAFFHRTGHGIGLDGHEDPYLVAGNDLPLDVGMAFSVEPGIYLPGRCGARIEDIVVCGPDGPIVLNEASRELVVVDG
jgi:Xaa-Pro aminopeptidase